MKDCLLPNLEWEMLGDSITIPQVKDETELPPGEKKIIVNRDEEYNLKAVLDFKDDPKERKWWESTFGTAGGIVRRFDVKGSTDFGTISLESCLLSGINVHYDLATKVRLGRAFINFHGLRIKYHNDNEITHLIDWYLNGPRDHVFHRSSDRRVVKNFSRERLVSNDEKIDSIEMELESGNVGADFLRIQAPDFQFLITKVPEEIGPSWSSNIGIEYRKEWGHIPNEEERESIEELCSFVFGRQLLSIGYSAFDQKEYRVESYSRDPWGKGAKRFCVEPDYPPVRIDIFPTNHAEKVIGQLLPKYCEMRIPLFLREAFWYIWISRQMPVGTNLPMLAAAIESIMNGWFMTKSKSHGFYLEKKAFVDLISEETKNIRKKLEEALKTEDAKAQKIVERILQANEFGIMERYRIFFEEIGILISKNEWQAINERHEFIHGRTRFDNADWKLILDHVNTYETLLNKVILKILVYSGTYIDRALLGWPDGQLS
jgi:hypothetical protein